jgi:hypothetical protein
MWININHQILCLSFTCSQNILHRCRCRRWWQFIVEIDSLNFRRRQQRLWLWCRLDPLVTVRINFVKSTLFHLWVWDWWIWIYNLHCDILILYQEIALLTPRRPPDTFVFWKASKNTPTSHNNDFHYLRVWRFSEIWRFCESWWLLGKKTPGREDFDAFVFSKASRAL